MNTLLWLAIIGLLALRIVEGRQAKRREDALRRRLEAAETGIVECLCGRR